MKTQKRTIAKRILGASLSAVLAFSAMAIPASAAGLSAGDTAVTAQAAAAGKITLSKTALTIARGKTSTLTVKFSDGVKTKITWKSSNKLVCAVDNGKLTAKSAGTAVITAKTPDGRTAKCTVTVVVKATKIKLDKTSLDVYKNSTVQLKATVYPSSTTNKTVRWRSSNTAVAAVSAQGIVTGISKGKATITAISSNGLTAKTVVNVIQPASGISFKKSSFVIGAGETVKPAMILTPASSNEKITFTSDNTAVASVTNGKITGKAPGTAVIKAAIPNGKFALCTVTVKKAPDIFIFKNSGVKLGIGEAYTPEIFIDDDEACSKFTYSSSDTSVLTVSAGGKVTAKKAGTATVTAKAYNGRSCSDTIQVLKAPTSIKLSETTKTLEPQKYFQLKVSFLSGEWSRKIKYTSSNTAVCTVDKDGFVTAKAEGTATVTARTFNGKTAACKVTVKKNGISDSDYKKNFTTLKNYILAHYEDKDENGDKYIRYAHPGSTEDTAMYVVFTYMASQNKIRIDDCIMDEQANIYVTRVFLSYSKPDHVNVELSQMNFIEVFTNPIGYIAGSSFKPSEYTRTTRLSYNVTTDGDGTPSIDAIQKLRSSADSQLLSSLLFADSKLRATGVTLAMLGFTALKTDKVTQPTTQQTYEYKFILNVNSMVYHLQECGGVKRMNQSNKKIVTITAKSEAEARRQIEAQGYTPCGTCAS